MIVGRLRRFRWGPIALGVALVLGPSATAMAVTPAAASSVGTPPVTSAPPPSAASRLEACRQGLAAPVVDRRAAMCFYDAASKDGRWEEVVVELEALVAEPGAAPMLRLPLALVLAHRGELRRAVTLLSELLESMPNIEAKDRAVILINRGDYLLLLGRHAQARAAFEEVVAIGRAHGWDEVELAGELELGFALMRQGSDLSRVRALYDRVVPLALEKGSYSVVTKALVDRATLWVHLGKTEERRRDYEQLLRRARERGDAYHQLFARAQLLNMDIEALDLRDARPMPPALQARLDQILREAEESQQLVLTANLRCTVAELLASEERVAEAALAYERCAQDHEQAGLLRGQLMARNWQALHLSQAGELERARGLAADVDERVRARGMRGASLHTGFVRTVTVMRAGDVEQALAHAEHHFDDVEFYREIQGDQADRSREFSNLLSGYYFVSGSLLGQGSRAPFGLDTPFQIIERMRARNLLDGLRRSDAMRPDPDDPDEQRWQRTVTEIAEVQRTLLLPRLDESSRRVQLRRLDELEARERRLRTALAEGEGELGALLVPELSALAQVQAALAEHEALLSYQLADEYSVLGAPEGGSWVWVITRDRVEVHPLPERRVLDGQLAFVAGLFARRDGLEADAMTHLHRELVAPALASLPADTQRIVIVPDGALWSLPFAALRAEPQGEPLVSRYSLSLVPSVTSWMRWGARHGERAPGLLALAQPRLEVGEAPSDYRQGTLASGLQLGALPRAQDEVDAILRIWGGRDSAAEVGEQASERFLKGSDLSRYGLLHFATHAVMDRRHPDRSAVVLAAGGDDEDGLLQAREIVRLPLQGKVIVLSACSGAAGAFVRGEGVMSLARAFLQGGAQAVVASRWPLADADAVALFERLYLHLGEGLSLSEALARAQRDLIEAGAPAAAWAGVVVLGRGDHVLVPRPRWWPWRRTLWGAGALLALLAGLGMGLRARAKRARRALLR